MSTRAEQVEACESAARRAMRSAHGARGSSAKSFWSNTAARIDEAAATLTRDGLLRERLAAYADELSTSGDPEEAETKRAIGAALKALLKETSDEG